MSRMAVFGRTRPTDPSGIPNAIVGSARRIHLDRSDEVAYLRERNVDQNQKLAWKYYDSVTEIKSAYNYYASVASRVRLFAGFVAQTADSPVPIGAPGDIDRDLVTAARYELDKLGTGPGGMPGLIRAIVLNLLVPGEGYLVGANGSWSIRSTSELRFEQDGRVKLITSRRSPNHGTYLPSDAFIARIWRSHPEFSDDADSALYGLFEDCSDLLLTSRMIRASIRSKLSAGLLYVADELRFQRSIDPAGDNVDPDVDAFEEELTLSLTDPVGDTDSPAEIIPLIIRGPAEFAEKGIVPIELGRQFDPQLIERYKQHLERILNGLEIPADLITSLHNVRYSNAQALMEDFLKAYIEPMIVWVCEALTTVYLRPKLLARDFAKDDVKRVSVWYDASEVVTRPDRSDAADNGYERMLISGRTWRDVHGFSELDAPKAAEIVQRIGVTGQIPPQNMIDVLRAMAPELIQRIEELSGKPFEAPVKPGAAPATINPGSAPGPKPVSPVSPAPPQPSTGITIETNPVQPPEGPLPPREGSLQVDSVRTDRILDALAALSTRSQPSETVRQRERRIRHALEADRRLRDNLSTMLDRLVADAIELVGSDVITASASDPSLDVLIGEAELSEAFALLPADKRAEFGLEDYEQTIANSIARGRKAFVTAVTRAQNQGWKALGAEVYEVAKTNQADNVEKAWDWVSGQLVRVARRLVHRPESANSYVPLDIVRAAQAIAGGSDQGDRLQTGRAVLSSTALRATGWEFGTRYKWVYAISENGFEPHADLDDVTFDSWESHELAAADPDSWPYVTHYRPGDHNGCGCDWLPEVLEPATVPALEEAERV